jgi:hypothetical protein
VQVLPRKVTKITQSVMGISITDTAMACLLDSQDVVCIWNDRHFKIKCAKQHYYFHMLIHVLIIIISFPSHSFPSEIHVAYRPPQAVKDAYIAKITSCDDTFAALSSSGEVFTFSVPSSAEMDASSRDRAAIKPQRVWALRKQFSGVRVRQKPYSSAHLSCMNRSSYVILGCRLRLRWLAHRSNPIRPCFHPISECQERTEHRLEDIQVSTCAISPARCWGLCQ